MCTNFVGPKSPMLYTKFEGHQPFSFGEEGLLHIWACQPPFDGP